MFEEVIKYLITHLQVEVEQSTDFGPVEGVTVKLRLGHNVISESSCSLPQSCQE